MNILEEIQNCPVEWKELGKVAHSIKTGLNPRKFFQLNTSDASNYYITVREIRGHKIVPSEKTDLINNDGLMLCQNRSNLEIGDVLFTGTGTIGNVAIIEKTPTNWNIKEGVYAIKPKKEQICSKFLMYLFESEKIRKDIEGRKAGGTVKSVSMAEMKKIKIPIPPLEIQEKIVQTLDKFTDYVTELTSRKKQYSFYRDKLLSFEDEVYQVEWKTLDAVSERTSNISWNKIGDDEKFKYIDLSSVDRVSNKITETTSITKSTAPSRAQKIVKSNDIILGTTRPTLKRFTKITDDYNDQICSTGFYVFRTNGEVLPNYVYHIFSSSDFYKYLEENQSGASYPAISDALVKKYKIPVPSLEIQSRIVQVLDNFDKVCNDLNIGLPKEIELRQKQYEYFREKLLTFVAEGEYTESRVE
ncbi:restriction endonuclease subunit S [Streptococcus mitis]|uniref:Type I restriction-modification system, specificity subunit S n=1 Tax=Streptococcus mitis TaxID=28037 RepID=A0A139QCH5_STRMT|nr:restriction endonuclease subunit S [Streptococcus mitis]KXU00161.1 Type I restriction-modification system, specificity subunit S [Streptococcus mitis]